MAKTPIPEALELPPLDDLPLNRSLQAAKTAKQDEFYTQYVDIQKEVEAYLEFNPNAFRGKAVYCNCDDPFESNFFKYFAANFNKLGLKRLTTTSYDGSPIAGAQLSFSEYAPENLKRQRPRGSCPAAWCSWRLGLATFPAWAGLVSVPRLAG